MSIAPADDHRYSSARTSVGRTVLIGAALLVSGCAVERIDPPGVVVTRTLTVKPDRVAVYAAAAEIAGPYSIVDDLDIEDDGQTPPRVLEKRLRAVAGDRGANAIILDPLNRKPNGTRVFTGFSFDDPFRHFRATAIWVGQQPRPVRYLGTLGAARR